MRRMKSLVAMAILAAVVGLSTPSAFADSKPIYLGDRAAVNNSLKDGIFIMDRAAEGIILSLTGGFIAGAQVRDGIFIMD